MNVGEFYLSLLVKDIQISFEFYQSLGFEPVTDAGSIEEKWIVMQCGNAKVGLYEGNLQKNTLTFNPPDARAIYGSIKDNITVGAANGLDMPAGPCYFLIRDPDGNPILFDQQND